MAGDAEHLLGCAASASGQFLEDTRQRDRVHVAIYGELPIHRAEQRTMLDLGRSNPVLQR